MSDYDIDLGVNVEDRTGQDSDTRRDEAASEGFYFLVALRTVQYVTVDP